MQAGSSIIDTSEREYAVHESTGATDCAALTKEWVTSDQAQTYDRRLASGKHCHTRLTPLSLSQEVLLELLRVLVEEGSLASGSTVQVRLKMEQHFKRARYMAGAHGCTCPSCIACRITACCGEPASSLDWDAHTS